MKHIDRRGFNFHLRPPNPTSVSELQALLDKSNNVRPWQIAVRMYAGASQTGVCIACPVLVEQADILATTNIAIPRMNEIIPNARAVFHVASIAV